MTLVFLEQKPKRNKIFLLISRNAINEDDTWCLAVSVLEIPRVLRISSDILNSKKPYAVLRFRSILHKCFYATVNRDGVNVLGGKNKIYCLVLLTIS